MSSAVAIELDTAAPELVFGLPRWSRHGYTLRVPFAISEPGVVIAAFEDEQMTTEDAELVVRTAGRAGTLVAQAIDTVLNASEWMLNVATPASYPEEQDETYEDRGPAAYDDGGGSTYEGRGPASYGDGEDSGYDN